MQLQDSFGISKCGRLIHDFFPKGYLLKEKYSIMKKQQTSAEARLGLLGPVSYWENPGWERHGYKDGKKSGN